jgi:NodT family efflux transporter outer membrane factor (OMF) lipoprotein
MPRRWRTRTSCDPGREQIMDLISRRHLAGIVVIAGLGAGCAVGPDFERPEAPAAAGYSRDPLPVQTSSASVAGGEAQRFVAEGDIPGQWWTLFRSPGLEALIEQAIKANPDLQSAQAALRQAWENVYAGEGAFFPTLQANYSASRNKTPFAALAPVGPTLSPYYTLHTAQLLISYVPDLWGGTRRQVESLEAQAELGRYQLEATYLTLTSNVVAAAVQEASLRGQIAATEEIIKIVTDGLGILQRQFALGQVARTDVAAEEALLAQAQATLPPLQKQLATQRDLLTALVGRLPSEEPAEKFELASLHLPQELPLSLPSKLVDQRPDVRSAEATLHSASAQIGVAIAARLPQISLTGNYGSTASTITQLFTTGTGFWTLAGSASQTVFDAGTLLHKERAAVAAFDQAAAMYRSTVITAFQNVADTLHALQSDANTLKAALAAEQAAAMSLAITRQQLQLGAINYLALINAQQTYEQALINLVQAQASRYTDTAALFQALGGGWWNLPGGGAPQTASAKPAP